MTRHQFFPACPPFVNTVSVAEVTQHYNMKETAATNGPEGTVSKSTGIAGTPRTRDETTTR